jgi:hypothetical protein
MIPCVLLTNIIGIIFYKDWNDALRYRPFV